MDDFDELAGRAGPAFGWLGAALIAAGLATALLIAPRPTEQGDIFRLAAIHRPAAGVALAIYLGIGALSLVTLRTGGQAAATFAAALAPTGMMLTLLALWTEALWRKPLRGLWWIWDAASASQLLLLFLLGGVIAIRAMIDDARRGDRAAALLAVMGLVNLPVLFLSLRWWDLLRHETARASAPAMGGLLLGGAVLLGLGFAAYAMHTAIKRARCLVIERRTLALGLRRLQESEA